MTGKYGNRCNCYNGHNSSSGRCHGDIEHDHAYCEDCIRDCGMVEEVTTRASHTPGPWTRTQGERFKHDQSAGIKGPDGLYLAAALDFNRTDRDLEVEANARAIAALPNVLGALEDLVRYHTDEEYRNAEEKRANEVTAGNCTFLDVLIDRGVDAIEKAKGVPVPKK